MIRTLYYSPAGELQINLPLDALDEIIQSCQGLLWVDFEGTPPEEDEPILRQVFGFHPLAIDDALRETHVPKLDDWESYLYIVLNAVKILPDSPGEIELQELDVFLGKCYMVTHHDQKIRAIDDTLVAIQKDERFLKNGIDRVLYRLIDELVNNYMPVVEHLDSAIDQAEDEIFSGAAPETLGRIFNFKRTVMQLRRAIGPQREVLNKLARDDYPVIDPRTRVYFRDVYDHLVRMHDIIEGIRDLVSGILDTYLSVVNNRMNDIMKTLTVITTLFMPISFIASFFGMNFFTPVEPLDVWTGKGAFIIVLCFTVMTPALMFWWIRRRGWMSL
jgi:magnesium transporter